MCMVAFVFPDGMFLPHYLSLFAAGIATCYVYVGLVSRRDYFILMAGIVSASIGALGVVIAIVGLTCAFSIAFLSRVKVRGLAWIGSISYSIYLIHVPIGGRAMNLGTRFQPSLFLYVTILLLAVTSTLVAAYVMYMLVERPSQRWSSSLKYEAIEHSKKGLSRFLKWPFASHS